MKIVLYITNKVLTNFIILLNLQKSFNSFIISKGLNIFYYIKIIYKIMT